MSHLWGPSAIRTRTSQAVVLLLTLALAAVALVMVNVTNAAAEQTYTETTGGVANTWTNYTNAGGTGGAQIGSNQSIQIACKVTGFQVSDGNTWWYRIASAPWNYAYYVSADAFYNNGATSGSLAGTPFVDPAVPDCTSGTGTSETVGGTANTWTNYTNAGGTAGTQIASHAAVQISCKLPGFRVADGNTWWYRIASAPWNDGFYVSADAFYNNGATSGPLQGTPFVDPAVPDCAGGGTSTGDSSVVLYQGGAAPAGFWYGITLNNFAAGSAVSVTCSDSVSPSGFRTFSITTNSVGYAQTTAQCYSGDGPDHWVAAAGKQSNHLAWGAGGGGGTAPTVRLAQGPTAPAGYRYAINLTGFGANLGVTVKCYDSASSSPFYSFSLTTNGAGSASTASYCYSADGPDHWIVAGSTASNHVQWGSGSIDTNGSGTVTGSGTGTPGSGAPYSTAPKSSTVILASSGKTVINGATLTSPRNSWHWYGNTVNSCWVQDWNSDKGWVVLYNKVKSNQIGATTMSVRNGMLFGWFDNGAAPGMGCPKSNEAQTTVASPDGNLSVVVQYFNGGALEWITGMDHAQVLPGGEPTGHAIEWALRCANRVQACDYNYGSDHARDYYLYCLGFVSDAFSKGNGGTGTTLDNVPYGPGAAAKQVWNWGSNASRRGTGTAPPGTMSTWGTGTYGHIALNIGRGYAVSTWPGSTDPNELIHVIRVGDAAGLQGWVSPVVSQGA